MQRRIELLGHYIDSDVVHVHAKKISAMKEFPQPKNATDLRGFLDSARYYRRFIAGFQYILAVLHSGTSVKEISFN